MSTRELRGIQPLLRTALLGISAQDAVSGERVHATVVMQLRADAGSGRTREAVRGPSGTFSFHSIPGMRAHEEPELNLPQPAPAPFALYALDTSRRFLPVALRLTLPRLDPAVILPMFPAASYPLPPEWAVLRGRVGNAAAVAAGGEPDIASAAAAWARLNVRLNGQIIGVGVADERGEFAVFFPAPPRNAVGNTTLVVSAQYAPATLEGVPGSAWLLSTSMTARRLVPDIGTIVGQQAAALVTNWPVGGNRTTANEMTITLSTGVPAPISTLGRGDLWLLP